MELGPMRLNLLAETGGKPDLKAALKGAEAAVQALYEISRFWDRLRKPAVEVKAEGLPKPVRLMVEACRRVEGEALTPMAAVAGAISDLAVEAASREGAEKVLAENRGDIAVKLSRGAKATIGVKAWAGAEGCAFTIQLEGENPIGGIATSGLGGMGLTKGIATAAVALAPTGALADACSTSLGNATKAEDAPVLRRPAEELDPLTDLKGQLVTYRVGKLTSEHKRKAVENGLKKALDLLEKGVLLGAIIVVEDVYGMIPEGVARVEDGSLKPFSLP